MNFSFGFSAKSFRGCSPVFPHGAIMRMQYLWVSEPILDGNGDPIRDANDEVMYDSGWRWVDTIGLTISELYPLVDPALRSIISADGGTTKRANEEIVTLALAHADLNRSTMCGSAEGGIVFYPYLTTPVAAPATVLTRACRHLGATYTPPTGPDQFTITDQTGVELSTMITSASVTVTGCTVSVAISVTGLAYRLNGAGSFVTTPGIWSPGDTVEVQRLSDDDYEQPASGSLNINGVSDTFSITTRANVSTVTYTDAQLSSNYVGYFNRLVDTTRCKFHTTNRSSFSAYVRGTAARFRCGGGGANPFMVSIDGGTPTQPNISSEYVQLFTGLSDTEHLVEIYPGSIYANNAWTFTSGVVLEVTGASPQASTIFDVVYNPADPAFPGLDTHAKTATYGGNVTPTHPLINFAASDSYGQCGATRIRAQASEVWVLTGDNEIWMSVDNAYPVKRTIGTAGGPFWRKIDGLDSENYHDYTIISKAASTGYTFVAVAVKGSMTSVNPALVVMQLGDSITRGTGAGTSVAAVDTYKYATSLGAMPSTTAKAGITIETLTTAIPTIFGFLAVPDIAVLAIGRNNVTSTEADFKTAYTSCINALLTAGCTKIICRGITPNTGADYWATQNSWISAVVDTFASSDIVYVGTGSWTGIATSDGTHPNETGYVTMADYEVTAFDGIHGL